jgi:hypothetical protein
MRTIRECGLLVVVFSCLAFLCTCERDTRIVIKGSQRPRFILTGSGRLSYLRVHGPKVREGAGETAHILWEIVANNPSHYGSTLREIGTVVYGEVPNGYVQTLPEAGMPPELTENENYDVWVITDGANGAKQQFEIRNGRVFVIGP